MLPDFSPVYDPKNPPILAIAALGPYDEEWNRMTMLLTADLRQKSQQAYADAFASLPEDATPRDMYFHFWRTVCARKS